MMFDLTLQEARAKHGPQVFQEPEILTAKGTSCISLSTESCQHIQPEPSHVLAGYLPSSHHSLPLTRETLDSCDTTQEVIMGLLHLPEPLLQQLSKSRNIYSLWNIALWITLISATWNGRVQFYFHQSNDFWQM